MLTDLHEAINKGASDLIAPTTGDGSFGGNMEAVTAPEERELLAEEPRPGHQIAAVNMQRVPITQKLADFEGVSQGDAGAFWEYTVGMNKEYRDSGEVEQLSDKEQKRLAREWVKLSPKDKLKWHRQKQADTLLQARKKVDTNPTEAQQEAGNYRKGHFQWKGLDITLENPKGSTRSGTDPAGKSWSVVLAADYGYIKQTKGADGDHVDCFVGPSSGSDEVFIVNQVNPEDGSFDEHKVLLAWNTEEEARKGYLANYEKGWKGLGSIKQMSIEAFKKWLDGDTTKRAAEVTADGLQDFFDSPPNKKGRRCPGCGRLFKDVEPYADVKNCETCERFGTKRAFVFSCCGKRDCSGCPGNSELMESEWYALKWAAEHTKVVAVDVDGTLAQHYDEFDADVIPPPRPGAKKQMERIKETGARIIINTVRGANDVTKAWLEEHDIPFDHINRNPEQPEGSSGKIVADVYLDDRAVSADQPLRKAMDQVLEKLSLNELHDSISGKTKSAEPYWQRGLKTQLRMPTWNPEQNPLDNILANVSQARQRGEDMVRGRDAADDIRSHFQPGFALQRFQRYMRHGDHVKDPLDRLVFRHEPLF